MPSEVTQLSTHSALPEEHRACDSYDKRICLKQKLGIFWPSNSVEAGLGAQLGNILAGKLTLIVGVWANIRKHAQYVLHVAKNWVMCRGVTIVTCKFRVSAQWRVRFDCRAALHHRQRVKPNSNWYRYSVSTTNEKSSLAAVPELNSRK